MPTAVYRFKTNAPGVDVTFLQTLVAPTSVAATNAISASAIDITEDTTLFDDLSANMTRYGWTYIETNPSTTIHAYVASLTYGFSANQMVYTDSSGFPVTGGKFSLLTSGGGAGVTVNMGAGLPTKWRLESYGATGSEGAEVVLRRSRGTSSVPVALNANDYIGGYHTTLYGSTTTFFSKAGAFFYAGENHSDTNLGVRIEFYSTPNGSATASTYFTINPSHATAGAKVIYVEPSTVFAVGSLGVGANLVVGRQSAVPVTPPSNTLAQFVGADTQANNIINYAYGGLPNIQMVRANNTLASPSAIGSTVEFARFSGGGYAGAGGWQYDNSYISFRALETWSNTQRGSDFRLVLTQFANTTQFTAISITGRNRNGTNAAFTFTPSPQSNGSGSGPLYLFNTISESSATLQASTNTPDVKFDFTRTKRHATGAVTLQADFWITAATHTAQAASAVTVLTNLYVEVPIATSNFNVNAEGLFGIYTTGRFFAAGGAEGSPGVVVGTNQTGMYSTSSTMLGFSLAGNRRLYLDDSVSAVITDNGYAIRAGTNASTPNFSFGTDTDTGLQYVSADVFGVKTNNTMRVQFHSDGDISIPGDVVFGAAVGTNPAYTVEVQGTFGASSAVTLSKRVTKTNADSPYTVGATDLAVDWDATSGACTCNLPASSVGRIIMISKTDSSGNAVTIDGNGSETINGALTYTLNLPYDTVILRGITGGWIIQ